MSVATYNRKEALLGLVAASKDDAYAARQVIDALIDELVRTHPKAGSFADQALKQAQGYSDDKLSGRLNMIGVILDGGEFTPETAKHFGDDLSDLL